MSPDEERLVHNYLNAKEHVIGAGYEEDITWAEDLDLDKLTESTWLQEAAWVIFNSGFRASTVRGKWSALRRAFFDFPSASVLVEYHLLCRRQALRVFGHQGKVDAVLEVARITDAEGWPAIREALREQGPKYLHRFPFIGPITCYHLARDLGLDCVKPDRHLVRIAEAAGYDTPLAMCEVVASVVGDRLGVIDMVLWRFATLQAGYEEVFR